MLISPEEITKILHDHHIHITGAFHVGAHECEEIGFYTDYLGLNLNDVVWIDAIQQKVLEASSRGIPNMFNAVITDKDDESVIFNISNNGQSSSVLDFETHATEHPHIHYVGKVEMQSTTIDTFFRANKLNPLKYNFWNFDIQGAELMALKGSKRSILNADVLYLEVNERELYKGCGLIQEIDEFLLEHRFKRVLTKMTEFGWGDALYIK